MIKSVTRTTRLTTAGAVCAVIVPLVACGGEDGDPAALLAEYVAKYNAHDLDAVMALFSDDAVMTRHPLDDDSPANGAAEIRSVHVTDMAAAARDDAYEMTDVAVEGNEVTFGHRWHSAGGSCFTGVGHTIVVEDDKIVSWSWPSSGEPCE